jgi:cytochrome oxidase Cu insertion factor (SCO1/SenC/PrrC family)
MNAIKLLAVLAFSTTFALAEKPAAKEPKKVEITMEDQFETKNSVADHKGKVLILVFGDRKGIDASRELGSTLHVLFHPTAEGKTAKEAKKAPVAALDGVPKDKASPEVSVVPVAVCSGVPGPIKGMIRKALAKDATDTPVWLDFDGVMADKFSVREGEPNLVLIDAEGRLRLKVNGQPDKETMQKILQTAQNLRAEAAGLR